VFGDDVVVNLQVISDPLPQAQLSCEDTISYLSSLNKFGPASCAQQAFRSVCCKTCQSIENVFFFLYSMKHCENLNKYFRLFDCLNILFRI
jgi:hypothetical protein